MCALFWRSVFLCPLIVVALLVVVCGVMYIWFILPYLTFGWKGLLIAPIFLAAVALVTFLSLKLEDRLYAPAKPKEPGFIVTAYRSIKNRYCPMIYLED